MRSASVLIGLFLLTGSARGHDWVAVVGSTGADGGTGGLSKEGASGTSGPGPKRLTMAGTLTGSADLSVPARPSDRQGCAALPTPVPQIQPAAPAGVSHAAPRQEVVDSALAAGLRLPFLHRHQVRYEGYPHDV